MKRSIVHYAAIGLVLICSGRAMAAGKPAPMVPPRFICPPCPFDCHDQLFDAKGTCPHCGVELIEAPAQRNVGILVWDGIDLLDFAGPAEVFSTAPIGQASAFKVFTVGVSEKPITSMEFAKLTPNYTIENCPKLSVMIIPGGNIPLVINNKKLVEWIKHTAKDAELSMSVCSGAFMLGKAGLLDDQDATSWHGMIPKLKTSYPAAKMHCNRRFVFSGNIATAGGGSAGIEAALYAVTRLCGPDVARASAMDMDYNWTVGPDGAFVKPELTGNPTPSNSDPTDIEVILKRVDDALASGQRTINDVLINKKLAAFHADARFRDLVRRHANNSPIMLVPADEPGEKLSVSGQLRDPAGKPIDGAMLCVFHADNEGSYTREKAMDEPHSRIFGWIRTGPDGRFAFSTIHPGGYKGTYKGSDGVERKIPQHIHFEISAKGYAEKKFQMVFDDDSRMDAHWRKWAADNGHPIVKVVREQGKRAECVCDVTLKPLTENTTAAR